MIPYSEFVPRLFNFSLHLCFRSGLIIPPRAICSDEKQVCPSFSSPNISGHSRLTFPFNHGRVGGVVAIDRHSPHITHGEDAVIYRPVMSTITGDRRILSLPPTTAGLNNSIDSASTSHSYGVTVEFQERLKNNGYIWKIGEGQCIGSLLAADLFFFR